MFDSEDGNEVIQKSRPLGINFRNTDILVQPCISHFRKESLSNVAKDPVALVGAQYPIENLEESVFVGVLDLSRSLPET